MPLLQYVLHAQVVDKTKSTPDDNLQIHFWSHRRLYRLLSKTLSHLV